MASSETIVICKKCGHSFQRRSNSEAEIEYAEYDYVICEKCNSHIQLGKSSGILATLRFSLTKIGRLAFFPVSLIIRRIFVSYFPTRCPNCFFGRIIEIGGRHNDFIEGGFSFTRYVECQKCKGKFRSVDFGTWEDY